MRISCPALICTRRLFLEESGNWFASPSRWIDFVRQAYGLNSCRRSVASGQKRSAEGDKLHRPRAQGPHSARLADMSTHATDGLCTSNTLNESVTNAFEVRDFCPGRSFRALARRLKRLGVSKADQPSSLSDLNANPSISLKLRILAFTKITWLILRSPREQLPWWLSYSLSSISLERLVPPEDHIRSVWAFLLPKGTAPTIRPPSNYETMIALFS